MRNVVLVCAWLAGTALPAAAQVVSSVTLSEAMTFDGLFVAADGTLYGATGASGDRVVAIGSDGEVRTIARGLDGPVHLAQDDIGRLYVTTYNDGGFFRIGADEAHVRLAGGLNGPSGVVRAPGGNFFVSQWGTTANPGETIRRISTDGSSSTYAQGSGLNTTQPIALDESGFLYVGNATEGSIRRISPDGSIELFVKLPPLVGNMVFANGNLYVTAMSERQVLAVDIDTRRVSVVAGDGNAQTRDGVGQDASFEAPWGLAVSPDGSVLWVVDVGSSPRALIRRIDLGRPAP